MHRAAGRTDGWLLARRRGLDRDEALDAPPKPPPGPRRQRTLTPGGVSSTSGREPPRLRSAGAHPGRKPRDASGPPAPRKRREGIPRSSEGRGSFREDRLEEQVAAALFAASWNSGTLMVVTDSAMSLTSEETTYLQVTEVLHKLKLQSRGILREEKQPASAHSTPSSSPHSSPKHKSRGWFTSGPSTALPGPNPGTMDSASGDKDKNLVDKCSLFGPRSLQKSDSGGFAIQTYRGAQKPSPMELIHVQAIQMAKDPATFKPPKMDILLMEGKKPLPRTHNLKPCDLNVLTPTVF
ncbi:LOW QUALITY PROTEIN: putative monooxygenase p33MONOX [Enhydra lutris kenyoni]|uniref:Putative monooxygenase p33MONOX n=1 Tax=Enhydra lutris kenyoni TaxID=391180 RepID=A0A2Y9JXJ6_ENHLU|nr:LOW QUALITY PROTEIN: putative monooxygenase p33MONOX [Enhydra lutris kenyoni]